jgi:hypothetical protein
MSSTLVGYKPMQGALITDEPGLGPSNDLCARDAPGHRYISDISGQPANRIKAGYCGSHPSTRQTCADVKLAMTFSA